MKTILEFLHTLRRPVLFLPALFLVALVVAGGIKFWIAQTMYYNQLDSSDWLIGMVVLSGLATSAFWRPKRVSR